MQSKRRASTDKRSCQHSMTVFFTADTHFGDHRVLNISKRPFSSVDEMDAL
jgi:calcineurin-like phosphoesterase family protein